MNFDLSKITGNEPPLDGPPDLDVLLSEIERLRALIADTDEYLTAFTDDGNPIVRTTVAAALAVLRGQVRDTFTTTEGSRDA